VLIIPGDIGAEVDRIQSVLSHLTQQYDAVCYVPGNHEAWRQGTASGGSALDASNRESTSNRMATDSVAKLTEVLAMATSLGVYVGPLRIFCSANSKEQPSNGRPLVTIYPLYSWYHSGWDTEPSITHPASLAMEKAIPFQNRWGDFFMCSWPSEIDHLTDLQTDSRVLANAFAQLNEPFLPPIPLINEEETTSALRNPNTNNNTDDSSVSANFKSERENNIHGIHHNNINNNNEGGDTVISFSHFVPRIELSPEKRFLIEPGLAAVIGSHVLEQQIRRLSPHIHLFGHTHIPIDLQLDGIRYIQWPLGYHR